MEDWEKNSYDIRLKLKAKYWSVKEKVTKLEEELKAKFEENEKLKSENLLLWD